MGVRVVAVSCDRALIERDSAGDVAGVGTEDAEIVESEFESWINLERGQILILSISVSIQKLVYRANIVRRTRILRVDSESCFKDVECQPIVCRIDIFLSDREQTGGFN